MTGKIAYVVKTFPKISETFILREVLTLEEQGVELEIFSLRQPAEEKTHACASQVKAPIYYIPESSASSAWSVLAAHARQWLRQPGRYCRALTFILGRSDAERWQDFFQAGVLAQWVARSQIAHIHAHFINLPATVAELAHLMTGKPFSITAHAKDIYLSPEAELARKISAAEFVVTCNEYNRKHLNGVGNGDTPVLRVYHGLDLEQFQPSWLQKQGGSMPVILSVGRLREKKGFPCLLEACRLLRIGGYRFRCIIAGYGPMRETLQQQIAESNLTDMVELTGMLTQEEVLALYRRADLFVLPCQVTDDGDRDGIPNVLMEAMAMELPVVSTPVAGIPELIESFENGVLVNPEDPNALAAAMVRLLDQPELRRKLGVRGRAKVCEQFSSKRNAALLRALFSGGSPKAEAADLIQPVPPLQVRANTVTLRNNSPVAGTAMGWRME